MVIKEYKSRKTVCMYNLNIRDVNEKGCHMIEVCHLSMFTLNSCTGPRASQFGHTVIIWLRGTPLTYYYMYPKCLPLYELVVTLRLWVIKYHNS